MSTGAFRVPEVVYEHYYVAPAATAPVCRRSLLALSNLAGKTLIRDGVLSFGGLSLHIGAWKSTWIGEPLSGAGNYTLRIEDVHLPATVVSRIDPDGHLAELLGGGDLVFDVSASGVGKIINDVQGGAIEGSVRSRIAGHPEVLGRVSTASPRSCGRSSSRRPCRPGRRSAATGASDHQRADRPASRTSRSPARC